MLHANIEIAQVLDVYDVRIVLTEFVAGEDPIVFVSRPSIYQLPPALEGADTLSTVIAVLALWSERAISE